jgi:hypothetical protein
MSSIIGQVASLMDLATGEQCGLLDFRMGLEELYMKQNYHWMVGDHLNLYFFFSVFM